MCTISLFSSSSSSSSRLYVCRYEVHALLLSKNSTSLSLCLSLCARLVYVFSVSSVLPTINMQSYIVWSICLCVCVGLDESALLRAHILFIPWSYIFRLIDHHHHHHHHHHRLLIHLNLIIKLFLTTIFIDWSQLPYATNLLLPCLLYRSIIILHFWWSFSISKNLKPRYWTP